MPHNTLQKIENGTYVETEHTYDISILLTYQIFVFAHISRIEEEYHITGKDQTKNSLQCFCLLKRFSTSLKAFVNGRKKGQKLTWLQ